MSFRTSLGVGFVLGLLMLGSSAHAQVVADSRLDFSNTQGRDGWYYGYYNRTDDVDKLYEVADFTQFPRYNFDASYWFIDLDASDGEAYFTATDTQQGRVNSETTSLGRTPEEHWNVRRYVSEVSGEVNVSGFTREDLNFDTRANAQDDGVIARIYHNGEIIYERDIGRLDVVETPYSVFADLALGDTLDFVVTPKANDFFDCPFFVGTVSMVPEPGMMGLAGIGIMTLARRRR